MTDQGEADRLQEIKACLNGRSVIFIGMPGAGKSTLARKLANKLNAVFIDIDKEIEDAAQISIPRIFELYGEPHFRDFETKILLKLLKEKKGVFAIGGGAYMNEINRKAIAEAGVSVWLKVSPETLFERTVRKDHRPLLNTSDPRAALEKLFKERNEVYKLSDVAVENDDSSPERAYEALILTLENYLSGM